MAGPPVDRVLRHALEAQAGAEQRRHDLAQRPGPGELPVLLLVGDRQPVDVLGRPAARRLRAPEVVVVGQRPAAVGDRRRTATRPGGRRRSRAGRPAPAAAAAPPPRRRGPGATGSRRGPCRRGRRCRRARAACRARRPRPIAPARRSPPVSRAASSSIRGLKSTPTTSSAPEVHSDSVSRPPAHWRWIARRQRPRRSPIRSCSTGNRFEPPPRISSTASSNQPS